ncbi:PREDICTED: cyclin-dependent kinase 2-interacting protein-like [Priapulus caudatus]|uniref:Cyclin-dependent kinase 2-interacting protein-like n=1 Tax=Priapulus caudatus TaxID=37621 RepID=A0ABM1E6K2_PRICU|nr:PREDICTED: cyclin-dependent kinase 2-interacting protein-like [Priapulus caudatus]
MSAPTSSLHGNVLKENNQFIAVTDNECKTPSKTANLTGLPRRVKDCCADWYNYVQKWEEANISGATLVKNIANCRLKLAFDKQEEQTSKKLSEDDKDSVLAEMQTDCEELETLYQSMAKILAKMETITSNLQACATLHLYQSHSTDGVTDVLFQTWPTAMFGETSSTLLLMYQHELPVKQAILHQVAHLENRELLMLYVAAWVHQAYIEPRSKALLEAMLAEVQLR